MPYASDSQALLYVLLLQPQTGLYSCGQNLERLDSWQVPFELVLQEALNAIMPNGNANAKIVFKNACFFIRIK
jgi:hypothetical protein